MIYCEVCQSRKVRILSTEVPFQRNFGKCSNCGCFQNINKNLPSQIEGDNFEEYVEAQDEKFEKLRRAAVLSQIEKFLTRNQLELSVYDIGTGAGKFLNEASQLGFAVAGNELSHTAAALVLKEYGFVIDVENYENLGFTNCQNSVTMFCVLAHSVNPESLLRSIHQSLRNGGVLYFHTPRYCLIDSMAIWINFISFGRMNQILIRRIGGDHKRIYSRKSLLKLLEKSGFSEFTVTPEIGYGLNKENYFTAMGMPKFAANLIATVLDIFSMISLLPRNVFSVYAIKTR